MIQQDILPRTLARPVKKVFLPWPDEYEVEDMGRDGDLPWPLLGNVYEFEEGVPFYGYVYHSRRLAYAIPTIPGNGSDMVAVLDLETGERYIWPTSLRGNSMTLDCLITISSCSFHLRKCVIFCRRRRLTW